MRTTFDISVGVAVILTLGFTISMWWYMREDYFGRKPEVSTSPMEISDMASPTSRQRANWRFPSLALFGAIVLLSNWALIAVALGWVGEPKQKFTWVDEPVTETIAGKHYFNERVVLDGKSFKDCYFTNVTFVFNGTKPFSLTDSHFIGRPVATSENPVVMGSFVFLRGLAVLFHPMCQS